MKTIKYTVMAFVAALLLTSCSITEKIVLNENGSGKFSYEMDGSKMMSMLSSAMEQEGGKAKKKKKKKGKNVDMTEDIDTTFTFKQIFDEKRDSIAQLPADQQAKLKAMENFSMRMVMKQKDEVMRFDMFTDFNSFKELTKSLSPSETLKSLGGSADGMQAASSTGIKMPGEDAETSYTYDGKKFTRTVKRNPMPELTAEEKEAYESSMKSAEMIFEQSDYKLEYHFPKPVKKVSIAGALYSEDRKTVTINVPFKAYIENPEAFNLEVEFE